MLCLYIVETCKQILLSGSHNLLMDQKSEDDEYSNTICNYKNIIIQSGDSNDIIPVALYTIHTYK